MSRRTVEDEAFRAVRLRDVLASCEDKLAEIDPLGVGEIEVSTPKFELLRLASTPQPAGGHRWWFICSKCLRRCTRLYRDFGSTCGQLKCRICRGLTYRAWGLDPA